MSDEGRRFYLRIALIVVGLIAIFGLYPLLILWPAGWAWGHGHSHYVMMIVGIYATLGVFLIIASQHPEANRSLIWFTIWSSLVHGGIMTVQAIGDSAERGHLLGDVPALFLIADRASGFDAANRASASLKRQPDVILGQRRGRRLRTHQIVQLR